IRELIGHRILWWTEDRSIENDQRLVPSEQCASRLETNLRLGRLVGERSYGHCKGAVRASFGLCKGSAGATKNDGGEEVGSIAGNFGSDDFEDLACSWATAWVWDCAANRAG